MLVQNTPKFVPRAHFGLPSSLPRSYFLGHHKAGLDRMKTMLSQIDLVIECRDYRIPITGRNPEFEKELGLGTIGGKSRIVVYTKCDLGVGSERKEKVEAKERDALLIAHHSPQPVHFSTTTVPYKDSLQPRQRHRNTTLTLLNQLRAFARTNFSLTGHRVLIAGMPNVGKSTLLNALRKSGIPSNIRSNKKVAQTGADPGVTRSVGNAVKILTAEDIGGKKAGGPIGSGVKEASAEGVYLLDTPGVFMPYVPDAYSMLKLALCGAVKDSILPPITVADYLLFCINGHGLERVYDGFCEPTNDVIRLLEGVCKRTGRLRKKAELDLEGAALWFVKKWRQGIFGRFVIDVVDSEALRGEASGAEEIKNLVSWSQAVRKEKERRRERKSEHVEA